MSEESIKVYFSTDTYSSIEEFKKDVLANFTTILTELSAIFHVDRHIDVDNFKPLFKTETVYNGSLKEAVDQAVILFQKVKTNLMEKSV